ncbi:MAG TPA: site-2 protease family protein [Methanocellaceae archaeon]
MITLSQADKDEISKVFTFYEVKERENYTELYGDPLVDVNRLYGQLYDHFSKQNESVSLMHNRGESVLVIGRAKPDNIWINVGLAVATLFTTMAVGSLLYGVNIIDQPLEMYKGLPFALAIMLVLGSHELGHYIVSRKHGIDATLPYFIPFPIPPIGTMGAIIRQKGPVPNRKALFDVGISGPMIGLVVAVIVTAIGLMLPPVAVTTPLSDVTYMKIQAPLLFDAIAAVVHPGVNLDTINPIAFAGWVGMLVTMLNMIPVGQLDGGHVARALLGEKADRLSRFLPMLIMAFGLISTFAFNKSGDLWIFWGLLTALMSATAHPKPVDDSGGIGLPRIIFAVIAIGLTILCFTPFPLSA